MSLNKKFTENTIFFDKFVKFAPAISTLLFVLMVGTLIQNLGSILNQKPITEHSEVLSQTEHIQNILTQAADLQQEVGKKPPSLLIAEYNKISDEFNTAVLSIAQIQTLKNDLKLKNKVVETNNKASEFMALVKKQVSLSQKPQKIETTDRIETYLKDYSNLSMSISLSESYFSKLNSPTLLFLSYLFLFSTFNLAYITLNFFSHRNKKNILFQTQSQLNTFQSVMNNMSEGVIVTNPQGFFTYYNQSALDIIGPVVKDVHYQSSLELMGFRGLNGEKIEKKDLPFHTALKKEIAADQEIYVLNSMHPDGIYISTSSGYYVNQSGATAGSVVVMKNITHKKQLEELWSKQKEAAVEASKKKSDFLASMSHEIRTPMNGIIGITTLLNETKLSSEQKDYVGTVQRSAQSLLSLINDILDHSKIEAGKVNLVPENFNLKLLIKDVYENFKYICSEKNIQLLYSYPNELPEYFFADGNRLRQILMNLIGNAVKFTTVGQVELQLEYTNTASATKIRFKIKDTGAGMDPDEVDRLFQRFFQTKSGIKFGGTGLGLSISKQLVDLMDGKIGVNSQAQVGTTFWFELVLAHGAAPLAVNNVFTLQRLENAFDGHILIAEDNLVNQKVVTQYLKKLGFTVDIANNGAEAVEKFQTNAYNLIFMDCQMPIMTGYEATEAIVQLQSKKSEKVPIIALTAEGTSGEKLKCFASGMSEFLSKPLAFEQLAMLLKKYFPLNVNSENQNSQTIPFNPSAPDSEIYKLGALKVGDQLLLNILLEDYTANSPLLIEQMKNACERKNTEEIYIAAHTLKSASATLSATTVSSVCLQIEKLTEISDYLQIQILISKLQAEYNDSVLIVQSIIEDIQKQQKVPA
jgi:signal transduction histidine kinase/CheY-like chemotaxis protein/HPt (histidine-containing phosphotransfer) domain-containing protein